VNETSSPISDRGLLTADEPSTDPSVDEVLTEGPITPSNSPQQTLLSASAEVAYVSVFSVLTGDSNSLSRRCRPLRVESSTALIDEWYQRFSANRLN